MESAQNGACQEVSAVFREVSISWRPGLVLHSSGAAGSWKHSVSPPQIFFQKSTVVGLSGRSVQLWFMHTAAFPKVLFGKISAGAD